MGLIIVFEWQRNSLYLLPIKSVVVVKGGGGHHFVVVQISKLVHSWRASFIHSSSGQFLVVVFSFHTTHNIKYDFLMMPFFCELARSIVVAWLHLQVGVFVEWE